MSAAAISRLPSIALASAFSHMGRGLLWLMGRALRAPLASLLLIGGTFGFAAAASNALYGQTGHHPAPFFTDHALVTSSLPQTQVPPVVPLPVSAAPEQSAARPASPLVSTPAPVMPQTQSTREVTNASIKTMQQQLSALGFYHGEADGFYGPKTAEAIRAFEAFQGMTPVGAVTPSLLDAIDAAQKARTGESAAVEARTPIVTPPQAVPSQAPVEPQAASRIDTLIQDVERGVAEAGERLSTAASDAQRQLSREIEKAAPADNISRIVEQVAARASAPAATKPAATDPEYVKRVQRGLASLGFLQGSIDGVAGEDTARAIRNFEVYYNYRVTGEITPELLDLLSEAGAQT